MDSKDLNRQEKRILSEGEISERHEEMPVKDGSQQKDVISSRDEISELAEDTLRDVTGGLGPGQALKATSTAIGRFTKSDFGSFLLPGIVGIGAGAAGVSIGQDIKKSHTSNNSTTTP